MKLCKVTGPVLRSVGDNLITSLAKLAAHCVNGTEKLMKKALISTNYSVPPLLVQSCLSLLHLAMAIGMVQIGLDAIVHHLLLINENKASAVT